MRSHLYSTDTSWIMTVAWLPSKHRYIDPHKARKKREDELVITHHFSQFTRRICFFYQVSSLVSSDSPDVSSNLVDHLPPRIPRDPCWHPNRRSLWPWTSQRARHWWPSPPWHLGSFVPRGFSRDPWMVEAGWGRKTYGTTMGSLKFLEDTNSFSNDHHIFVIFFSKCDFCWSGLMFWKYVKRNCLVPQRGHK